MFLWQERKSCYCKLEIYLWRVSFHFGTETVLTWCFQVQGEQTFLFQDREEGEGEEEGKGKGLGNLMTNISEDILHILPIRCISASSTSYVALYVKYK